MGTGFSGERGGDGLEIELDHLRDFFQPKPSWDSMIHIFLPIFLLHSRRNWKSSVEMTTFLFPALAKTEFSFVIFTIFTIFETLDFPALP